MRDESIAKDMASLMREVVSVTGAPEETRRALREKIDEVCGDKKSREQTKRIDEFSFKTPRQTLEGWKGLLKQKGIEPVKDMHFKVEYGVNYINTNAKSYTQKEEEEAWKEVDKRKEEWDAREEARAAENETYEAKEMSLDEQRRILEGVKRRIRIENRKARVEPATWEIVQRTQNNDSAYEDKELRFKEKDERFKREETRDTDWYQNIQNIAELGAQLGYTEKHYKNVLSRFISWFNPELTIVTENLTANETARFLLRLHTPDTEEEKLDKQIGRLTRKAGTTLRPVMAYLYEIVNAKYKGCTPLEKETEIRKEMMRGLVKFTRGDLQIQLVQCIEVARKKKEKLDWKLLLEKAIEGEMLQGMPQVDIKYQNTDANEAALQKLYNVSTGIDIRPGMKPKYEPGKGDRPRIEEEETERDLSDYLGDYPSTRELTEELRRNTERKQREQRKERKQTEQESGEEGDYETGNESETDTGRTDNIKTLREEKDKERKKLEEMIKNSEYMKLRQSERNKNKIERLGVNTTVTDNTGKDKERGRQDNRNSDIRRNERDNRRDKTNSRDRNSDRNKINGRDRTNSLTRNYRRDNSREWRRNSRSNDRNERRNNNGDRAQSRDRGRNWSNNRDRNNYRDSSRDRQRNPRDDRGRSRERKQDRSIKTNYASADRNRFRSNSRTREERERSDSRNRREYGITRRDYENDKGLRFGENYDMKTKNRKCSKCGSWFHHPWECKKYERYSREECMICNKKLHHWEIDCMGGFRDPDKPYPRGKVIRAYSRERTPDRNNRAENRENRSRQNSRSGERERSASRDNNNGQRRFVKDTYKKGN